MASSQINIRKHQMVIILWRPGVYFCGVFSFSQNQYWNAWNQLGVIPEAPVSNYLAKTTKKYCPYDSE